MAAGYVSITAIEVVYHGQCFHAVANLRFRAAIGGKLTGSKQGTISKKLQCCDRDARKEEGQLHPNRHPALNLGCKLHLNAHKCHINPADAQ